MEITDSIEFFWDRPKPLLNYLILTHVFSFCSLNEIKTCRLVCEDWYTTSLKKWRSKMPLRMNLSSTSRSSGSFNADNINRALKCDLINLTKYPYKRMVYFHDRMSPLTFLNERWSNMLISKLTHIKFHNIQVNEPQKFQRFLLQLPLNLKVLVLNNVECYEQNYFKTINFPTPTAKPQVALQVCEITGDRTYRYFPVSRFCIDWLPFLLKYPNLNSISMKLITPSSRIAKAEVENIIAAMESLQNTYKQKCNIAKLDLINIQEDKFGQPTTLHPTLIERLSRLNLPLNTLTIDFGKSCPSEYLLSLFKSYNSLKHFECTRASQLAFKMFPFDLMPRLLTSLYLDGNVFSTVECLKYTPHLKKLRIESRIFDNYNLIDATDQTCIDSIKLQHLEEFMLACESCGESAVKRIINWSSKLTKLQICLKPVAFPLICSGMRNLEELKIFNGSLNDEIITGFSDGSRVNPNITDLKNLQSFIMYSSQKLNISLGDLSVIEGFLKSPRLKLISAKFDKLSSLTIAALHHSKVVLIPL